MSKEGITPRTADFSEWYQDVIAAADLAEHSGVKGSMIIKPYGYSIWERMQRILDHAIKKTGHQNAYFPLLIPESYLNREKAHVEGFSPELAVVTHAGGEQLAEPLVIRPTSETIIYATFAKWIQSWRDLPLLINQWANVVRWELRPRLFLRTTEFLWQEGHTAHATELQAETEARTMLGVYKEFMEKHLAIPVIDGQKSDAEKFAGAYKTYTVEAMMQDGKALQAGTSHNLGQNFAKVFDVMYTNETGAREYVWQTSWGVSTRMIGALIMTHSDDKGLVLPPSIAPMKVVIIPIGKTDEEKARVLEAVQAHRETLSATLDAHIDDRDHYSPGMKFNEWEKKGIPIRIEVGPRDLEQQQVVMVRRDTGEKEVIPAGELLKKTVETLREMQQNLYIRARTFREEHTYQIDDYQSFREQIEQGGFIVSHWCGSPRCEEEIRNETKATIRCIPFVQDNPEGRCVKCSDEAMQQVIFARAY